jgi:tRNA pseudouridine55 synthase
MTNESASIVAPPVLDGVLNVSKPAGWTSHDVVEKFRRSLGIRKVGHAGTLDPAATGVLPMLLGKGTRLSEYLVEWDKEYEAVMRLGQDTDTQDATGAVIQERSYAGVTEESIRTAAAQFLGAIQQVPPMYSALKVEGQPLYKLARAGKTVERAPRPITIYQLEVLKVEIPDVSFRVTCSKGTYIRTLCADIGQSLGAGGHLRQLCRTRVGPFHIEDAVSPLEIGQEFRLHGDNQILWGLDAVLSHLPEVVIDSSMVTRALNGAPIPQSAVSRAFGESCEAGPAQEILRVKDSAGQLLGLGKFAKKGHNSTEIGQPLEFVKVFGQSS